MLHLIEQQNLGIVVDAVLPSIGRVLLKLAQGLTDVLEAEPGAAPGREAALQSTAKVRARASQTHVPRWRPRCTSLTPSSAPPSCHLCPHNSCTWRCCSVPRA